MCSLWLVLLKKKLVKHGLSCSPLLPTSVSPLLVLNVVTGDCEERGLFWFLLEGDFDQKSSRDRSEWLIVD